MNIVNLNQPDGVQAAPADLTTSGNRPFLTASWTNLFVVTYAVPPTTLTPYLFPGLSPDLRDGDAFVSLVAFDFRDTRVLGIPWPGYRNFPELNLRFYVRQGNERGVVFVREIVPQRLVAWMARSLYNEPYRVAPLSTTLDETGDEIRVERCLKWKGREYSLRVTGSKPTWRPSETSDEHFFLEQRWGFGADRRGRTIVYEVRHPTWETFPVTAWQLDFDWAHVYGPEWQFLQDRVPRSIALAAGSAVTVSPHARIAASREA
jgi:uncharacterized protein YqjF (DUF2071 family)